MLTQMANMEAEIQVVSTANETMVQFVSMLQVVAYFF